ncbi:MAG: 23S rRNA (adenine(1618)-N(6))-methyltransferase RlmF [Psychrilyobacter sp.]|nr:23S rRNA (adenine(1618)-N(6))-methyltransferase RlmF [Psychrilyobacter sp.]
MTKNESVKKKGFHKNNKHIGRYNLKKLIASTPELGEYIVKNPRGEDTIDFGNTKAVLVLNKALLKFHYNIIEWDIPTGFLAPPIPGRADYIHYIADLFPKKKHIKALDIGTGANCIYPLIGTKVYKWNFIASDIDPISVENAKKIVQNNNLEGKINIKLQEDKNSFFKGIIDDEYVDFTMCNPPFHSSIEEALGANKKKRESLNKTRTSKLEEKLNFGGQKAELWCKGGEILFLKKMIKESILFADRVGYFTSLISKSENIKPLKKLINKLGATEVRVIDMYQGNKISRILIWKFN